MRTTTVLLLTILCSLSLAAQSGTSAREEVAAARKAWWDAFLRRDVDTMVRIEADDIVFVNNGVITDRSRLARMRGLPPIVRTDTLDVQRFEVHGDLAIMSGFLHMTSPLQADPARVAFSDVWIRQGVAWRLKSSHLSRPVIVASPGRTIPGLRPASELPSDLRDTLTRREQVLKAGNGAGYEELVTDDLINVTASGDVESKADRMAYIGTGNLVSEEHAGFRGFGDDTVIYTYFGSGTPQTFVSEVWVKGTGGWRMAHRQSTWK